MKENFTKYDVLYAMGYMPLIKEYTPVQLYGKHGVIVDIAHGFVFKTFYVKRVDGLKEEVTLVQAREVDATNISKIECELETIAQVMSASIEVSPAALSKKKVCKIVKMLLKATNGPKFEPEVTEMYERAYADCIVKREVVAKHAMSLIIADKPINMTQEKIALKLYKKKTKVE